MTILSIRRRGNFLIKLASAAAMVITGDLIFWQRDAGGGLCGIYGLILLMGAIAFRPVVRRDRRALFCTGLAAIAAFAMAYNPSILAWCLFWIFAGMGALFPATARFDDAWRWFQRLVLHAFRSPLAPMFDAMRVLRIRRPYGGVNLGRLLPQVGLPLVGSLIIIVLFCSANPVIEQALGDLLDRSWSFPSPIRLLLWAILFACSWSQLRPRLPRHLLDTFDGHGDLFLPGVTVNSVRLSLIVFNALFALQNGMDLAWLWGFLPLPKGVALAEYAHRGAYPLIVTALLAGLFVLVALRPGSQTAAISAIRRMVVLWVVQNVLLVANAALRTLDYIAAFSLTSLRIAALLWMGLVALGLVLTCWRMLAGKGSAWLINTNAAAAMTLLIGCSFVDLDAAAAAYNVDHAREVGGNGAPIDMCYLSSIGPAALLPLADLEQRQAPEAIHLMARLLRENAQIDLATAQAAGRWSLLGSMRLADLRVHLRSAALTPKIRYLQDCTTRDVHVLRVAMELEMPAPERSAGPAVAKAALTPAPER